MRLLVVEDERQLNKIITERLTRSGYCVDSCFDGEDALYYIDTTQYDGIILDIMLPKVNGRKVLETIRSKNIMTPVLMLTALDAEDDIIIGLDSGANDYVTKPFSFEVLSARIRAMLRSKSSVSPVVMNVDDLKIDTVKKTVTRGDIDIELSSKEYAILEYLVRNKNIIVSKKQIEENIWNYEYEGTSDIVKVYIHHLRRKIDDGFNRKLLHTVKNVGYVIRGE